MSGDDEFAQALSLHQAGRLAAAAVGYAALVEAEPTNVAALFNLAVVRAATGAADEALAIYQRVLALRPGDPSVLVNLALLARGRGDAVEAERLYRAALSDTPGSPTAEQRTLAAHAHNGLGALCRARGDLDAAVAAFRAAVDHDPHLLGAHCNLSVSLAESGRHGAAMAAAQAALALEADYVPALVSLATALAAQRRYAEAEAHLGRACELAPDDVEALVGRAEMLERLRRFGEAIGVYQRVLEVDPDHRRALARLLELRLSSCDWSDYRQMCDDAIARTEREVAAAAPVSIDIITLLDLPVGNDLIYRASRAKAKTAARAVGGRAALETRVAPETRVATGAAPTGAVAWFDKLRLGYLLPYTSFHSMPALLREIATLHDRAHYRVHGYSLQASDGTAFSGDLRARFDAFTDVPLRAPERAAERIGADDLHILVDLAGLTAVNGLEVLAHRPVPVQAHFLGYGLTTGADFVDYLITDRVMTPPSLGAYASERLVYLPHAFMAARSMVAGRQAELDPPPARSELGLPEAGLVFCNFTQFGRIEPTAFAIWMRLLDQVPGSVLWLVAWMAEGVERLRAAVAAHGIDPDRLVFAPLRPYREHLGRIARADLVLDTLHHGGGVTTLDAIAAGVPVVTRAGETPAARLGASLLSAAGMPELIADDLVAYERKALDLARDAAARAAVRARLARDRSTGPLFDVAGFVGDLEAAYQAMWRERAAGPGAPPLAVRPTPPRRLTSRGNSPA